jgi:hypothetical protein
VAGWRSIRSEFRARARRQARTTFRRYVCGRQDRVLLAASAGRWTAPYRRERGTGTFKSCVCWGLPLPLEQDDGGVIWKFVALMVENRTYELAHDFLGFLLIRSMLGREVHEAFDSKLLTSW